MYKREKEGEFKAPVKIFKTDIAGNYLKDTGSPPSTITRNTPIDLWAIDISAQELLNICWNKTLKSKRKQIASQE